MTIAFDAASNNGAGVFTTDISWNHPGAASGVKGVLVLIINDQSAATIDWILGVTYGGVAMTEVPLSPFFNTLGLEDSVIHGFFLGSSVPQGTQAVAIDVNGTATTNLKAAAVSFTAANDTAVEDTSTVEFNPGISPVSVALTTSVDTWTVGALHSGHAGVTDTAPDTGYTDVHEFDFGSKTTSWIRSTAIEAAGSPAPSWTLSTNVEEVGILSVAVKEAAAVVSRPPGYRAIKARGLTNRRAIFT